MISSVIDIDELISQLETLQGWCEWQYSIEYQESIDSVIELLKKVKHDESGNYDKEFWGDDG